MAITVGDVLSVSAVIRSGGSAGVLVTHQQVTDLGTTTGDANLIQEIHDDIIVAVFGARLAACITTESNLDCVKYQKVSPTREGSFLLTAAVAGLVAGDTLPMNAAALLKLRCSRIGKRFRGHHFVPAIPESSVVNNRLRQAVWAQWRDLANFFPSAWTTTAGAITRGVLLSTAAPLPVPPETDYVRAWADPKIRKVRNRTAILCPV